MKTRCMEKAVCRGCGKHYTCNCIHISGWHKKYDGLCFDCTTQFLNWVDTLNGRERLNATVSQWKNNKITHIGEVK